MTNVDALKKLYIELGGNKEDIANIETSADMIEVLANIAGGTIELPAVSSTDNGDVLTVVSGKWAKAELPVELPAVTTSDEGNALIVSSEGKWAKEAIPSQLPAVTSADEGDVLTVDSEGKWAKASTESDVLKVTTSGNPSSPTLSATYKDIDDALDAGKFVYLMSTYDNNQMFYLRNGESSGAPMVFFGFTFASTTITVKTFTLTSTNELTIASYTFTSAA